jgi:hypothetical protein
MKDEAVRVLQRVEQPVVAPEPTASWRTRLASAVPTPTGTPFTFGYLIVLLGTTLLLRLADPVISAHLLALSSTDAHNLWHRPLFSLVFSALWISDQYWLPYVLIFALTVAPLERRIGPLRTAGVFFSGHIVATLATEVPIMVALSTKLLPKADARWLDIGVSYGFFTTAGALTFLLTGRRRLWALVAMETVIALIYVTDDPASMESVVTFIGHAVAAQFGLLCCGPVIRRSIFHNKRALAVRHYPFVAVATHGKEKATHSARMNTTTESCRTLPGDGWTAIPPVTGVDP